MPNVENQFCRLETAIKEYLPGADIERHVEGEAFWG